MPITHPIHIETTVDGDEARLTRETDDRLWIDFDPDGGQDSIEIATNKRQALALADKIIVLYRGRRAAAER